MKKLVFLSCLIILAVLQLSAAGSLKIFNTAPDFILIGAVACALYLERAWVLIFSGILGAFKDAAAMNSFGMNTFIFFLLGFFIIKVVSQVSLDYLPARFVLVLCAAFIYNLILGLSAIINNSIPAGIFLRTTALGSLYTALASCFIFTAFEKLMSYES